MAYHEAMQDGRRLGVHRRALDRVAAAGSAPADPPWAEAVRAETVARVRSALQELPQEQRQVVEDRIYRGKTFARIATDRGVALGTVLTRMRLALDKLARSLRGLDPGEDDTDARR